MTYGIFEFVGQINTSGKRILLFSSNPIPAGSLLILFSIGPLFLSAQTSNRNGRLFGYSCLTAGVLLLILIGQRGPLLALVLMVLLGAIMCRKGGWVLILATLLLVGMGYLFKENFPPLYKKQLSKKETILVDKYGFLF